MISIISDCQQEYLDLIVSMETNYKCRFYIMLILWNIVLAVPWFTLLILHLVINLINGTDIDLTEDIGDIFGNTGCVLCCVFFSINHKKWTLMFKKLSDFRRFGKPPKYGVAQRRGNMISKLCFIYGILGVSTYVLVSMIDSKRCQRMNLEKHLHEVCGTFSPAWIPNGDQIDWLSYIVLLASQCASGMVYLPSGFILSGLPLEGYGLIVARIRHLKVLIKEVLNIEDPNEQEKNIKIWISYHQEVIRLSEELNSVSKLTIGHVHFIVALVIGCLGSQVLKQSTPKALAYIAAYIGALFMMCHPGQSITDESLSIGDEIYDSNWYEASPKIRKYLTLIILRSQKPLKVDALPLGSANYAYFLMILKTSYSYLTLLNQVV